MKTRWHVVGAAVLLAAGSFKAAAEEWKKFSPPDGKFTVLLPDNRPAEVYGGTVTLHAGGPRESWLLLPVIPPKS